MNAFVADPHWGWWIVFYFYLGGIAAGAFFAATLIDLSGYGRRDLSRTGYRIAFPLIAVCGVLLVLDLDQPARFWHMLFRCEAVREAVAAGWPLGGWNRLLAAPMIKPWSPMSIGSWGLLFFGLCSGLLFLISLPRLSWLTKPYITLPAQLLGCLLGAFVAAYTGVLLTATNQPMWSDSHWISALFLASAVSTGLAAMVLLSGHRDRRFMANLEQADRSILVIELLAFSAFAISLGEALPILLRSWRGWVLFLVAPVLACILPLGMLMAPVKYRRPFCAAALVLAGGFLFRFAVLVGPRTAVDGGPAAGSSATVPDQPDWFLLSPEDGRRRGEVGADPQNKPADPKPPSKVFQP